MEFQVVFGNDDDEEIFIGDDGEDEEDEDDDDEEDEDDDEELAGIPNGRQATLNIMALLRGIYLLTPYFLPLYSLIVC